jgi:GntR family transcriptional regulator
MSGGWEPVAPWRTLYALLKGQIESGEYPPRSRLPSIVALSQEHGLSGKTVRKALDQLKEDGLVVTSPMGTFVAESPG